MNTNKTKVKYIDVNDPNIVYLNIKNNVAFLRNQSHDTLIKFYKLFNNYNNTNIDNNTINVVIYSPKPDYSCGGIMVLLNLAKTINNLNYKNIKAYVYFYDHVQHKNEFCNNFFNPFDMNENTIVIYPETIVGNPLNAKHVIRWILLELGLDTPVEIIKTWQDTDLIYSWEPSKIKNIKQLVNIWVRPEVKLYNSITNRDYSCYALKKMVNIPHSLHPSGIKKIHEDNSICIDGKKNIKDIVKIFNICHTFYCYDPNCFFAIMAPLCGCVTVLHPIIGITKEQYYKERIIHKNNFYFDSGIAYGSHPKEVARARESLQNVNENFKILNNIYKNNINIMLSDLFEYINNKIKLTNTLKNTYKEYL